MKRILLIISILTFPFLGCSDDDKEDNDVLVTCDSSLNDTAHLFGNWKLMAVEYIATPSNVINYSNQNVSYNFHSDSLMTVSGSGSGPHTAGDYTFQFILYGLDPVTEYLKIGPSQWLYCIQEDVMILYKSHVDGANLHFKKR